MDLKEISSKLKNAGLGYVKIMTPQAWDLSDGKCYTDYSGKKLKGIQGGSIGPMTMTDAHFNHNRKVENKLRDEFPNNYSFDGVNSILTFKLGNKIRRMIFVWTLLPANSASMNLDSGYKRYWYTPLIKDSKE